MAISTENVWEEFHPRLRQFILKRISDEQNAEDVLQEVFLKIHTRIGSLREEEKLQSWIYQITRFSRVGALLGGKNPGYALPYCV